MNCRPPSTHPARRPIVIAPYNPDWPGNFNSERFRILQSLAPMECLVEHIGSTAVPGLAAKPVIDIMIGLDHRGLAKGCIPEITSLGYVYVPEFESAMPYRRFFYRDTDGVRSHHIHMVASTHEFWMRHLLFRDYLRTHPELAREYEALKRTLAVQYGDDVAGYSEAKTVMIAKLEALARADR